MTHADWVAAAGAKIDGSWNMHELLGNELDFFIMLSSISGIVGNPGQANYAAGNTFQDGLAHFRRGSGLKATSINLSAVAGIGYLAENAADYDQFKLPAKMTLREDEIHHVVLAAISGIVKKDHEMPPQLTTGIIGGETLRSMMPITGWANDSKFILLRKADGLSGSSSGDSNPTREAFMAAESLPEAAVIVELALTARLAKALYIPPEDIDVLKPLHAYGGMFHSQIHTFTKRVTNGCIVDSLIAVEVRNWVLKEIKSDISILDILSPMSIQNLSHKIAEGSKVLPFNLRVESVEGKEEGKADDAQTKSGEEATNEAGEVTLVTDLAKPVFDEAKLEVLDLKTADVEVLPSKVDEVITLEVKEVVIEV
jgi:hypothetical protein